MERERVLASLERLRCLAQKWLTEADDLDAQAEDFGREGREWGRLDFIYESQTRHREAMMVRMCGCELMRELASIARDLGLALEVKADADRTLRTG